MSFLNNIDWQIVGSAGLGTGLVGLIFKVAEKLIDQKLDISKEKRTRRYKIIESAQDIISEAESSSFKEPPKDKKHTVGISNKLTTVDKKLAQSFNSMLLSWEAGQIHQFNAAVSWDNLQGESLSKEEEETRQKKLQKHLDKSDYSKAEAQQHALDATERIKKIL